MSVSAIHILTHWRSYLYALEWFHISMQQDNEPYLYTNYCYLCVSRIFLWTICRRQKGRVQRLQLCDRFFYAIRLMYNPFNCLSMHCRTCVIHDRSLTGRHMKSECVQITPISPREQSTKVLPDVFHVESIVKRVLRSRLSAMYRVTSSLDGVMVSTRTMAGLAMTDIDK